MKRLAVAVCLSSIVAVLGVSWADLGEAPALGPERVAAQARGKRPPRGKRGASASSKTPAPAVVACGGAGQPRCPLDAWMEENVEPAAERGDLSRLAELYTKMAGFAPDPSWNTGDNSWRAIAEGAAAKARAGDMRGARSACKSCHQAWKERYRNEFRARALPN
jgi:hypothetical protein